jgi:lipoprotein-anchoring transpeptidase ErfK/SrfK
MAVITVAGKPSMGVNYTVTTASSADWSAVSNSTYFYDLTDKIVRYKNASGIVLEIFTNGSGFSPQNIADCDTAPTAASTQYYYQTISEITGTISKVKLWGFSGTDLVRFGLYRGALNGTMTLIGQGSITGVIGANEITLTAEVGQTLNLVAGENLVVGYYADGISWRTVYNVGIADAIFGIINTANITTMPATPTGTATGIRFACTLY